MKNLIYISIIVISVFVVSFLLIFYYTQDFSESFGFKNTFSLEDVQYNSQTDYIDSVKVNLGTLSLQNRGYFEQVYSFPVIVGCINIKQNKTLVQNTNLYLRVYLGSGSSTEINSYNENTLTIPIGQKKDFTLMGAYRPYGQISLTRLQESVESISLYKLNKKETNPFGEYYYDYSGDDCVNLKVEEEPIKTIVFINQ